LKLKVITLTLDATTGVFDDAALQAFCDENEVLDVHEHFFVDGGRPTWAMLLRYRERAARRATGPVVLPPAERAEDAPLEVPAEARALFDALRHWRNARAKRDGRPAYVLFHNKQLLAIAMDRPASLAALGRIEGVGEAKLRDYGAELLALIAQVPVEAPAGPPMPVPEP
jgi:superfamily II DNA helicase RecQ